MHHRRRNPAIVVAKSVTSPATVLTPVPMLVPEPEWPPVAQVLGLTLVAVAAVKNVTNAASSAILLVTAPKVVEVGSAAGTRARVAMAVEEALVVPEAAKVVRLATLAAATVTCLEIVHKGRNATTVRIRTPQSGVLQILIMAGGEVGHLSRDCPSEPSSERVCYKCKQPGHIQAVCVN